MTDHPRWRIALLLACAALPTACAATSDGGDAPFLDTRVETRTGSLHVRHGGNGPDLVLLHGLGDSGVGWRKVAEPLRQAGFRVTIPDALGTGLSDKPVPGDYRLSAHVERLAAVLDALGIERATLIGNSLGGSEALLFAERWPERVERLVLVDPAAYPEGGTTSDWLWTTPLLAEGVLATLPPAMIARAALQLNFGDPSRITPEDLRVYTEEAAREGAIAALIAQQRQLYPTAEELERWIAGYASVRAPTLILWGGEDRVLPAGHGRRLADALPDADLVVVEGVGHVLQLEDPERFLAETLRFLREE